MTGVVDIVGRIQARYPGESDERVTRTIKGIEDAGYRLTAAPEDTSRNVWWCVSSLHALEWSETTEASPPVGSRDCAECGELALPVYERIRRPEPTVMPDAASQKAEAGTRVLVALDALGSGAPTDPDRVCGIEFVGMIRTDLGDLICTTSAPPGPDGRPGQLTIDLVELARLVIWPEPQDNRLGT